MTDCTEDRDIIRIPGVPAVFLSSPVGALEEYRRCASDAIERMGFHCIRMETFAACTDHPEQVCRRELENADFFVGVLGREYGSIAPSHRISYSELEYNAAVELGLRPLMFLPSESCPLPSPLAGSDFDARQQAFAARMEQRHNVAHFDGPADLAQRIMAALHRERVESLNRKSVRSSAPAPQVLPPGSQRSEADPELVRRMRSTLLAENYDPVQAYFEPYERLNFLRAVIHSDMSDTYPDPDPDGHEGISTWFRVDLFDTYDSGIKVLLGGRAGLMDRHGFWDIVDENEAVRHSTYYSHDIWTVGCIPYAAITAFRPEADNWYSGPHIYCDFRFNGEPYEALEHYVSARDKESDSFRGFVKLDPMKRRHLE